MISKPKISLQQFKTHLTSLLGGGGEVGEGGDNWSKEVKAWLLKIVKANLSDHPNYMPLPWPDF